MTTIPGHRNVVLAPIHEADHYVVRVIHDRDGDELFCTEPSPSLDAAIDEARWQLEPWEDVSETRECEEA